MNRMQGGERSGVVGVQVHNQRQWSSENFLESSSNGRWLQSDGFQHLQQSSANGSIPPLQDYIFYGGGGQALRMYRNAQKGFDGGNDVYMESSTPPVSSRPSSQRKGGEPSPSDFSPGLLDLHSFDTELLPEMPVPALYDGSSLFNPVRGRSFDDSEPCIANNKQIGRARGLPENNLTKSFAADKEKANASSVSKTKVVVRKRPLNKKELAKSEEDIVETYSNSLTVYETKLKLQVEALWYHT